MTAAADAAMQAERHVIVSANDDELSSQLTQYIRKAIADHQTDAADRPFVIGYSGELFEAERSGGKLPNIFSTGGSMPKLLVPVLKHAIDDTFRANVRLFPVDERLVPLTDDENNTRHYIYTLGKMRFPKKNSQNS